MIIVTFPCQNGTPDYDQFGGIDLFGYAVIENDTVTGEFNGGLPLPPGLTEYNGEFPVIEYRTQVTADEFIDLWSNDEWGDAVTSLDPDVIDFVTRLQNYKKTFDTGHAAIGAGMTKVVQNTGMTAGTAQQIIKGVRL